MNKLVAKIIDSVLKQALPMLTLEPTRLDTNRGLKAIRNEFGLEASSKVVWQAYITKREGTSNKYHYFAVLQDGDKFHAANAFGRIGYDPRVKALGTFGSLESAKTAAETKLNKKLDDDYQITKL